jgi:ubiquinone/menaquinone biosynthesis C-methylase UbiE
MPFFRKSESEPMAVTMTGVRLGNRLLSIGVRDVPMIAALAAKSGLTGQANAIEPDPARAQTAAAALEREGALVDVAAAPWTTLPYDAANFDIAILRDVLGSMTPADLTGCLTEVLRVLRPGGRAIVIEGGKRSFLSRAPKETGEEPLRLAGFAAVRTLGEADGATYIEGIKKA